MNQLEYIARQLSRAQKKKFEHYVISGIWHKLNDKEIKFITQQYVKRPEGIALTDMYFPQLKVHVEIDEGQHFDRNGNRTEQDNIREADIITATGHTIKRVVVAGKDLDEVEVQISDLVELLKDTKLTISNFKPWNYEAERNPSTYIKQKKIDLSDDVAFYTMVDTVKCFGRSYQDNGIRGGGVKHPKENGKIIWFPQLYTNGVWQNKISDDDILIFEKHSSPEILSKHIDTTLSRNLKRIVFAKVKSPLGDIMYRFKGEYEIDKTQTNLQNGVVYKRISESVMTYAPVN